MDASYPTTTNAQKCAPGHILVDEEYVAEVRKAAESSRFPTKTVAALTDLWFDDPDKAGLVAMYWGGGQDPIGVVDRIRKVDPSLYDMVAPDHIVGVVVNPVTGEVATSAEMGGPAASPAVAAKGGFDDRTDDDVAGNGVTIGVVDSGIRRHPWYEGSVLASPGSVDPLDEKGDGELDRQAGHGTFVTGLILQQAPGATVRVVRAFDEDGVVRVRTAARAIVDLDRHGADIINLSFGGYTRTDRMPLAHRKAFSKLREGTVVVAAAGNHNPDKKTEKDKMDRRFWPAAMKRVVAVAALDQDQTAGVRLAKFSNFGPWVTVSAVGTDLLSTFVSDFKDFDGWATWSGTSFAAPIVAGRIAAAMTDDKGEIVRTAKQAKEMVLEEATKASKKAADAGLIDNLIANGSGMGPGGHPVILSVDPKGGRRRRATKA